jgi:hypothetical protein
LLDLDAAAARWGGISESYRFYNDTIELRFDKDEHQYLLVDGDQLVNIPSVTQIVHIIDKSNALIAWGCKMMSQKLLASVDLPSTRAEFEKLVLEAKSAHTEKLEEAGNIGHLAHSWLEKHIENQLNQFCILDNPLPEDERAISCINAALDWEKKHNVKWVCTEQKVYSKEHKFAGTTDGLALIDSCNDPLCCSEEFKGRLSVVDWKTSNALYPDYCYQTAAYLLALIEEYGIS